MRKEKTVIEEIMEKSGNGFHARVVNLLREQQWNVLVSPYYSDNYTDKPREIDIIAEKKFDVNDDFGSWLGTLNAHFFVECKYITGTTIFWFDFKDRNRAIERVMTDTGMDHPDRNVNINDHHYIDSKSASVAKLFSSEKSRSEDNELVSKAINQNLNALVYYRNRRDIFQTDQNLRNQILKQISYPLIVVNSFDNFFRINMGDSTEKSESITEPFQLEVNYAYVDEKGNRKNEYFLIDVVSISKLPEFLAMLEKTDIVKVREKLFYEKKFQNLQRQNNEDSGVNFFSV